MANLDDVLMFVKVAQFDTYELVVRERKDPKESFSRVIRRALSELPAVTAGDLLDTMSRQRPDAP